jgi:hypothetical protein
MNPFIDQDNPFFSPDPRLLRSLALRRAPVPPSFGRSYAEELQQKADDLYSQGMEALNAPVDPSAQIAQMGRNQESARRKLALALAAQQAGKEFGPLGGEFLKQSIALRQPIAVGKAGVVDPSGQFVQDPTFETQQRAQTLLRQANQYDTLAQRAVNAEERMRAQEQANEMRMQAQNLAAQMQADRLALQQQGLDIRAQEAARRREEFEEKQMEKRQKKIAAIRNVEDTVDYSLRAVNRAEALIGNNTVGTLGDLLRRLPGNQARDLQAVLETIRANIGFQALANIRAASQTGGALGQITEREHVLLQATVASLDQSQTLAQFRQNLQIVKEYFNKAYAYAQEDKAMLGAGVQTAPAGAVRPRGAPPPGAQQAVPQGPPPGAVRPRGAPPQGM